jgi:hypothetical protein
VPRHPRAVPAACRAPSAPRMVLPEVPDAARAVAGPQQVGLLGAQPGHSQRELGSRAVGVDWDPARAAGVPGAQRLVDFEVEQVVQIDGAVPLR